MLAKICIFLVLLACRQGAATFYRHENPVTAAVQLGPLLVFLASPPSLCLTDAVANLGAGFNSSTTKVTLFQNRVFITKGTHDTRRTGHACCRHMPLYMCMQQAKPQGK